MVTQSYQPPVNSFKDNAQKIRVLFISRKHPPSVGGMEKLSYHLVSGMRALPEFEVRAIVWGHTQVLLPVFVVTAFFQSIVTCMRGVNVIHIGDPVLAFLGLLLRAVFHVPVAITVHGLDIAFNFPLYRTFVPKWVARYDAVICISQAVYTICRQHGVAAARCHIIHPGVALPPESGTRTFSRQILSQSLGRELSGARLLVTVGRLVPRKGVHFFVNEVLPLLVAADSRYLYLVIGEGPERERILSAIHRHQLEQHVLVTGYLAPDVVRHALNACDLFVAPNIPQPADMEGFGLVVLEAAAAGCAVLVAKLEGLQDTLSGENPAWFVPPADAHLWAERIAALFATPAILPALGSAARAHVVKHHSWERMVNQYAEIFRSLAVQ